MKLLKDILFGIRLQEVQGSTQVAIDAVTSDSRAVRKDALFVAIRGTHSDGHAYIASAVQQGAAAIVCEEIPSETNSQVTYLQVPNSSEAYAWLAANWFERPAEKLKVVGVTGTNGKTTTATLLYQLYQNRGVKSGLLSNVILRN